MSLNCTTESGTLSVSFPVQRNSFFKPAWDRCSSYESLQILYIVMTALWFALVSAWLLNGFLHRKQLSIKIRRYWTVALLLNLVETFLKLGHLWMEANGTPVDILGRTLTLVYAVQVSWLVFVGLAACHGFSILQNRLDSIAFSRCLLVGSLLFLTLLQRQPLEQTVSFAGLLLAVTLFMVLYTVEQGSRASRRTLQEYLAMLDVWRLGVMKVVEPSMRRSRPQTRMEVDMIPMQQQQQGRRQNGVPARPSPLEDMNVPSLEPAEASSTLQPKEQLVYRTCVAIRIYCALTLLGEIIRAYVPIPTRLVLLEVYRWVFGAAMVWLFWLRIPPRYRLVRAPPTSPIAVSATSPRTTRRHRNNAFQRRLERMANLGNAPLAAPPTQSAPRIPAQPRISVSEAKVFSMPAGGHLCLGVPLPSSATATTVVKSSTATGVH